MLVWMSKGFSAVFRNAIVWPMRVRAGHCFRLRFELAPTSKLSIDSTELVLERRRGQRKVVLRSGDHPKPIGATSTVLLLGFAYRSEDAARHAAVQWVDTLQRAFSRLRVGADFGERAPSGWFTDAGLRWVEGHVRGTTGRRRLALNDVHGAMVYRCRPAPIFVKMGSPTVQLGQPAHRVEQAVAAARSVRTPLDEREQLAFDLFSGSSFQQSPDARFVMLMMAVEALIQPARRNEIARAHVVGLISATKSSDLPHSEISSIVGTLTWLYNESIGQAGRQAVGEGPRYDALRRRNALAILH